MDKEVVLSIDTNTFKNPKFINLDSEIYDFKWLTVFTNAQEFRSYINDCDKSLEVWVCSSDDIEAINLAAAIKKDRKDCVVCLVSYDFTGSLQSRANAAEIDSVISIESLRERISARDKYFSAKSNEVNEDNNFKLRNIPKPILQNNLTRKAFVLSVLSASGGVGKSSVSVMSAMLCHAAGFKTLIIDADFQFGDVDTLFGIDKVLTIDELINNRGAVAKLKPINNCPCIIGSPPLPELSEKVIKEFPAILESLKEIFDVIIINTGSYWNEQQATLLERDSKSLFLIDQRPTSVNATKKAMDLCNRCGIATGSVIFAINRCSKHALFTSIDISCALQGANVAEIMDGGIEVDEYLSSGAPLELLQSRNSFAISIWSILESILPKELVENRKMDLNKKKSIRRSVKDKKKDKTWVIEREKRA